MERPPMALPAGEPENRHEGSGLTEPEIKGVIAPFPQILVAIEAKPSPSKDFELLLPVLQIFSPFYIPEDYLLY